MPGSYKWSLSLRFSPRKTVNISTLPHTCYTPAHLILFDLIARTILGEEYWSLSSLLCRSLHYPVPSDLNFSSLHITSNTFVVCGCTRTALSFHFKCVIYRRCQLLKWCITGGMMTTGESLNTGKNTYTSATYFTLNPMWTHLLFNPCLLDFFISLCVNKIIILKNTNHFAQSPISFYTNQNEVLSYDILGSHITTDDSCLIGREVRRPVYTSGSFWVEF